MDEVKVLALEWLPWVFSLRSFVAGTLLLTVYVTYLRLYHKPAPDIDPSGKVILVTGAASGIGKDAVERLLSLGCFVYATDINLSALNAAFGKAKNVKCAEMNVTDSDNIKKVRERVEADGRRVYGIVNSAGIAQVPVQRNGCPVWLGFLERDIDKEIWPTININLMGTIRVNQAFAEHVLDSEGVFLIISSIAGLLPFLPDYCASKHGVAGYAKGLRDELDYAGFNVRVVCLHPGFISTPMVVNSLDATLDYSYTRFQTPRLKESMDRVAAGANPVSIVSDEITRTLFTSKRKLVANHVIVDSKIRRLVYAIVSTLPHFIQQKLVALPKGERMTQKPPTPRATTSPSRRSPKRK